MLCVPLALVSAQPLNGTHFGVIFFFLRLVFLAWRCHGFNDFSYFCAPPTVVAGKSSLAHFALARRERCDQ